MELTLELIKNTSTENIIQKVQDNFFEIINEDKHLMEIYKDYF